MVKSKKGEGSQKNETGSDKSPKKSEKLTFSINKNSLKKTVFGFIIILLVLGALFLFSDKNSEIDVSGDIVARVNSQEITSEEINSTQEYLLQQGQQVSKKETLEQLIDQKLILQEAKKEGYSVSTGEAESVIEQQLAMQNMTLENYKQQIEQQIEQQDISYQEQLEKIKKDMAIQNYFASKFQDVNFNVTEQEIQDYYNSSIQGSEQVPPYEEVKSQIAQMIQQQKQSEVINSLIEELRDMAEIEYIKEFETSSENTDFPVEIQQ